MNLPVAIVHVDRILEQAGQLHQRQLVSSIELPLEIREVLSHLRDEAIAPPVGEVFTVGGKDGIRVVADPRGVAWITRHASGVACPVLT